jgi:hypothetical protein
MTATRAFIVMSMACSLATSQRGATAEPARPTAAASTRVGSGMARSGGLSRSMLWLLLGTASFSLALGTLGYSMRGRRPKTKRKQGSFSSLSNLRGGHAPVRVLEPAPHRLCPSCGKQYREDVRFCGRDGAPLMLVTPNH